MTDLEALEERVFAAFARPTDAPISRPGFEQRVRWILQHVPEGQVAVIGCGRGLVSSLLAVHGRTVIGIDPDDEAVRFADAYLHDLPDDVAARLSFRAADATDLPLEPGSVSAVVIGDLLEPSSSRERVIEEVARVLTPGGVAVVTLPSGGKDRQRGAGPTAFRTQLEPWFRVGDVALTGDHMAVACVLRADAERVKSSELAEARKRYEAAEKALRDAREAHARSESALKRQVESLQAQVPALETHLLRERKGDQAEIKRLEQALNAERQAHAELEASLQTTRERVSSEAQTISALQAELDAARAGLQRVERLRVDDQLSAADQRRSLELTVANLRNVLTARRQEARGGPPLAVALQEQVVALTAQLAEERNRAADSFRTAIQSWTETNNLLQDRLTTALEDLAQLTGDAERLRSELDAATRRATVAEGAAGRLDNEVGPLRADLARRVEELASLREQLATLRAESTRARERTEQAEQDVALLTERLNEQDAYMVQVLTARESEAEQRAAAEAAREAEAHQRRLAEAARAQDELRTTFERRLAQERAEAERHAASFAARERELRAARANAEKLLADATARAEQLTNRQADYDALVAQRDKLSGQVDRMQASRGWGVIVRYRYLRRGRLRKAFGKRKRVVVKRSAGADLATVAPDGTLEESPATTTLPARPLPELKVVPPSDVAVIAIGVAADATVPAEVEPAATPPAPVQPAPNPYLLTESDDPIAALDSWVERARAADAPEVVFMFSGTIHIQEKRGNRPIRLTREYLDRGIPVFFNYWRWRDTDTPPEFSHPLLLQSPIDITPQLLERLLAADFGPKRKLMFASFPHEEMVRVLSRATQAGWTTIYDARDDWEEFEKVGMAKWYDFAYETYITRSCDIVTAISRPLARKLGTMSGREDIHVVPNALDPGFPAPPGAREPKDPPVIGYFGHLTDKWFDWDLVLAAAKEYPTWRFELAGHQAPEGLQLPENVVLLGLLGHAELANLSRNWSAALIPFKVSALGEAVDPIKVYEYLHLGLPTLSSYMPQMRDYPGVTITESAAEFVAELPRIAASRLDETTVRQWLSHNRWPDRVDRYSELAQEVLAQPRSGFWPLLTADAVSA